MKSDSARTAIGRCERSNNFARKPKSNATKMILGVFLLFFLTTSANAYNFLTDEECLNYTVYPVQYELTIIPYIQKDHFYYNCEVVITVIANAPNVQIIELDAKDMDIKGDIKVMYGNTDLVNRYRPYEYNRQTGKLFIYLAGPLRQYSIDKTQYNIKISFRKSVNYETPGIIVVPYEDGGTKYIFATRLSPNKAKYFFPCFDNPRFEAVFKFRVYIVPVKDGVQYANSSIVIAKEQRQHDVRDRDYIIYEYIPSPQVGIHQVGFHYSQFGNRQVVAKKTNDTLIIWAPGSRLLYYKYIMIFGERILNLIIDYAAVNRPLVYGPINIVAVPKNLEGYEVSSWNLLTNGEQRLAYVPQFISIKQEELMTFELTQQLCRIWLGNPGELQRTRWTEEWFKEGVATYLAYYLLTQYQHDVQTIRYRWPMDEYGIQIKYKAMAEDWHHSTPALASFNRTLAIEIPSRYKNLVNMKTASILWMVENWLGSEKFHMALVKYINTRRGQFISLKDFMTNLDLDTVECLQPFFNGSTASRVLESWFHQPGYPVINVNVLRDRTPNAIQLKQKKFSFTRDNRGDSQYLIPVSYIVQNNQNCFNCYKPRFTIDQTYTFEENLNDGWIILNVNASGYYRVNYDVKTWKLIAKTLKENHLSIHEQNRAQIVNDALALYAAGEIDQAMAVEILDYLEHESSPIVWDAAINGFELLKTSGASCNMNKYLYQDWQEFMRNKVAVLYNRLIGDRQQQHRMRLFRSNIVGFACSLNHQLCVEHMRYMYEQYIRGKQRLDPDTRESCYLTLYQTNANFGGQVLNTFEYEDKMVAEHRMRKEKQFLYRIPIGTRVMDRLVMSTTPPVPTTTQVEAHSETIILPEKQAAGGTTSNILSSFCIIFAILGTVVR